MTMQGTRNPQNIGTSDFRLSDGTVTMPFRVVRDERSGLLQWQEGWAPLLSEEQRVSGPFSAQQYPAVVDIPLVFETWHNGCGLTDADDAEGSPTYYNYSQGIDASIPGRLYLSPKINSFSGDVSVAPSWIVETTLGVFATCGRYLYKLTVATLTWTQVHDLGSGKAFTGPPTEFNGYIFAPAGDSQAYVYSNNGTAWTASTLGDPYAYQFTVRGSTSTTPQFWKIDSDGAAKSNTSGINAGAAWSTATPLGHTSETFKSFLTLADKLFAFKIEGIASFDGATREDVWVGGRQMRRSTNGVNAFVWFDGSVYVPYGDRLMRYDPLDNSGVGSFSFVLPLGEWIGNIEVNGTITAVGGDADWLYAAVKNAAGYTYILKGRPGHGWNTFAYLGANDCNAIMVLGPGSLHSDNPALVFGYGTATRYLILCRSGLRPENDTNYRFAFTGTLYGPWLRVGTKSWKKILNAARAVAENCSSGKPITISYQADPLDAVTLLHTAESDGATDTVATSGVPFYRVRMVISMTTPDDTTSPRLLAAMFNTVLMAPRKKVWGITVECGPTPLAIGGGQLPVNGIQQRSFLFRADGNLLTLYDRNGQSFTVRLLSINGQGVRPTQSADTHVYTLSLIEVGENTNSGDNLFVLDESALDSSRELA